MVAVLVGVAALLMVGVAGVGALLLAPPPDGGLGAEGPSLAGPDEGPAEVGAHAEVTGDVAGSFDSTEPVGGRDDISFSNGNDRLLLGRDESGIRVEHFTFDRLDFYVDPGDCHIETGDPDPSTGLAPLDFSCDELNDVRGGGTVSVEGRAVVPARLVMAGIPEPGGEVVLRGDVSETLDVAEAGWFTFPAGEAPPGHHDLELWGPSDHLSLDDTGSGALTLVSVTVRGDEHEVAPGVCNPIVTRLARISDTETMDQVDIDCPDVSLEEVGTVSIQGTVVVDHLNMAP